MKRFLSVIVVLCMAMMSLIPATTAGAAAALTTSDVAVSELIFTNSSNGAEMSSLSRFSDQFNIKVILENELPTDTVATLEACGIYNNSTSTLNKNVKVTYNSVTKKSEFTFEKVKYSGTGSILKFTLAKQNQITGELSNIIPVNKTIDLLEIDYTTMYLEPKLILDSYTIGGDFIQAGKTFTLKFVVKNLSEVDAEQTRLKISSSDELTLKDGTNTINLGTIKARGTKTYSLTFNVPKVTKNSTQKLEFDVEYAYDSFDANVGRTTGQSQFSISLTVEKIEKIAISNVKTSPVSVGQTVPVSFDIVNSGYSSYDNASYTIIDGKGNEYASGYIGAIALTSSTTIEAKVKAFEAVGTTSLTIAVSYDNEAGIKRTITKAFTVEVNDTASLSLSNIKTPNFVTNQSNNIKFNMINMGKESFVNGQAFLYDSDKKLLSSVYFGEIAAHNQTAVEIPVTFMTIGSKKCTLKVVYELQNGSQKEIEQAISVTVTKSSELKMQRLSYPNEFVLEQSENVTFDVINTSAETFYNAEVYFLDKSGKTVTSSYIGEIAPRSRTKVETPLSLKTSGKQTLTVVVKYENAAVEALEIKDSFTVDVKTKSDVASSVKVQRVDIPVKPVIKAKTDFPFSVTNPQASVISNVEAFLLDSNGDELDSIYIGKIEPQTTGAYTLSTSFSTVGDRFLSVKISYTNSDNEEKSTSRSFNISVGEETEENKDEKPANIKIQKVQIPAQLFNDVKTEIPFTLVNAGKGTAYNVEIYVICNGEEIAREYVGNVAPTTPLEGKTSIRFSELGEYSLEFYVEFSNFDDSISTVSKSLETKVVQYRASVKDISGYEYLTAGYETNIEFTFLNAGTQNLSNVNAYLLDENGEKLGSVYVGNVDSGVEKARQRIKLTMMTAGTFPVTLKITYENTDMQEFSIENPLTMNVQEMYIDPGVIEPFPTSEVTGEAEGEGGINWILWGGIAAGVVVLVTVLTIVIIKKKKAKKEDDDDMEFFSAQLSSQQKESDTIKK